MCALCTPIYIGLFTSWNSYLAMKSSICTRSLWCESVGVYGNLCEQYEIAHTFDMWNRYAWTVLSFEYPMSHCLNILCISLRLKRNNNNNNNSSRAAEQRNINNAATCFGLNFVFNAKISVIPTFQQRSWIYVKSFFLHRDCYQY